MYRELNFSLQFLEEIIHMASLGGRGGGYGLGH